MSSVARLRNQTLPRTLSPPSLFFPAWNLPQFEKSENKPAIIGYSAAALGAFFTAEWLIHLPLLDFVSG